MVLSVTLSGPSGVVASGTNVSLKAASRSTSGPVWYQVWVDFPQGWKLWQNYSANATIALGPVNVPFEVVVDALTPTEVQDHQYQKAKAAVDFLNVDSAVSRSSPSSALAGEQWTLTAKAQQLINPVYQLWWETPSGQGLSSGAYTADPSFAWRPSTAGTYHLIVYAKDLNTPNNGLDAVTASGAVTVRPVTVGYGNFSLTGTTPGSSKPRPNRRASLGAECRARSIKVCLGKPISVGPFASWPKLDLYQQWVSGRTGDSGPYH